MKRNKINSILAAALLATTPVLWSACSDTWDDHYAVAEGGMADQPSILASIEADQSLANFLRVIKTIGGAETLDSPQQFTVWAPVNFTSDQADSVIAVYEKDKAAGLKLLDNRAMKQFMQNHVALYSRPVSSTTNDTIKMLNNKYMQLVGKSATSGTLSNNPFNEMIICNNGIIYKTQHIQNFFPNVREFIDQNATTDSLTQLIKLYDEYVLDEKASVAGGIQDGKVVYLDSVTILTNRFLNNYGPIHREDSVYTVIVPTDGVWKTLYEKYSQYYQYASNVNNADSLRNVTTQSRIIQGRFFNTSKNWALNAHPQDSLCNTLYSSYQSHNPRKNVFYNPQETLFAGLKSYECSNGTVYIDDKGVIDPAKTFFGRMDLEAYSPRYYENPLNSSNEETMTISQRVYTPQVVDKVETVENEDGTTTEVITYKNGHNYYYANVVAKSNSAQTSVIYNIPDLLSNVYYNVYVVTCPGNGTNVAETLPTWMQVAYKREKADGTFPARDTVFVNPHPVTAGSCENSDVILKQSKNENCFVTSTEKVDTILVAKAFQANVSGWGLDDATVKFTIGSWERSPSASRDKLYTRTLHLSELILVPFNTKEEAEAAADDIDAFNDVLLEANKEN